MYQATNVFRFPAVFPRSDILRSLTLDFFCHRCHLLHPIQQQLNIAAYTKMASISRACRIRKIPAR